MAHFAILRTQNFEIPELPRSNFASGLKCHYVGVRKSQDPWALRKFFTDSSISILYINFNFNLILNYLLLLKLTLGSLGS